LFGGDAERSLLVDAGQTRVLRQAVHGKGH
jgi:hypothetical protein